eukprot:237733-Chlamydomonas_euryale.AAC.9
MAAKRKRTAEEIKGRGGKRESFGECVCAACMHSQGTQAGAHSCACPPHSQCMHGERPTQVFRPT